VDKLTIDRIQLTAGGLFTVGIHFIPPVNKNLFFRTFKA